MVNDREGAVSFTTLLELDYVLGGVCCKIRHKQREQCRSHSSRNRRWCRNLVARCVESSGESIGNEKL